MIGSWWQKLSVSKKLYSVVGIMATLIAVELFTLYFAMTTLSAVRAFVGGEGIWSKAQKNAIHSLQKYALTHDEKFYRRYLTELSVPLGDYEARVELEKPNMDEKVVVEGFLRGQIDPSDIPSMIKLVRRFHDVPHLAAALKEWRKADELIFQLMDMAKELRTEINKKNASNEKIENWVSRLSDLDIRLTALENQFSSVLGEASRWLERTLMILLAIAVLAIESTGIFLTLKFGQSLKKVLHELNQAAVLVGKGDLSQQVSVQSQDELGQLTQSINDMIRKLRQQIIERENAQHASQAKNLFLANMSHEIRTPLNAILGFSELLQDPDVTETEKSRFAAIIKRTGASLTTIINDILDVAKVEAEQVKIERSHFSITQLVSDLHAMLRLRCEEKSIQLVFEQKGDVSAYILSDPIRLRQILANVIGNSIKFTDRGSVHMVYGVQDHYLYFSVTDTGSGITPQQAEHLFKPFSQGDSSVRKKYGGTGLGLVIAKHLAVLLGGDVCLQFSEPGVGSTFLTTIKYEPIELEGQVLDFAPIEIPVANLREDFLKDKIILVVEDSIDNQTIAQYFLSKTGAAIEFASHGEEGVVMASQKSYDLILMDIQMPIMDGYTATAELRKKGLNMPIIALTGYAMKEDQVKCLKAGCNEYLSKPYDREKLVSCMRKYLG